MGYLPGASFGQYPQTRYIVWDAVRRQLAAALAEPDGRLPDNLCLHEVENIQAIRIFNERYLNNPNRQPYIERSGPAFRNWSTDGDTLPREVTLVHFEPDIATPAVVGATSDSRLPFRFPRYEEIIDDWRRNISDHCPVKVWF